MRSLWVIWSWSSQPRSSPVDGDLVDEAGVFDESSLTGESLPVERHAGDQVLSGVVNGESPVTLRATATAADSQYAGIISLVEEATSSRSRVVRLADRFAVPFTLVALTIAGVAWWVSGDATRFAEVLVVATPCPLIIAAPVAYMGGMSRAAQSGIIVKSAETLEQLAAARTVAFDKTGTLTAGRPVLAEHEVVGGVEESEFLRLAASAEQYSSHVLAAALVRSATDDGIQLGTADHAEEVATHGVHALIEGRRVAVGKRTFIEEAVSAEIPVHPVRPGEQAAYVSLDGEHAGVLLLRDELRSNARDTIDALHRAGVEHVLMLTGDAEATARHVAADLGIDDVRAELLPVDKVEAVVAAEHRPVVMVGDGINDAPVLAAADVGIAMGARGATAASESADVVLLVDDIGGVAAAREIGRRTMRVALQSIGVGIGLSVVLMLIAAFGLIPAIVGAWLQEVVDLVVIVAALRALTPGRGAGG
jgi:heavy metal translocating P-type ATPase